MLMQMMKFVVNEISTPHEINAIDRGILELKCAVENLQAQVNELQHKIYEFSRSARISVDTKY
jgi:charged multivesicular body protein 7